MAGLVITVFILMEGFTGLGLNMLLVAVGPICIAFAAHEKTESYFWGFLKAFFFVGLLYMPLLGLACQFAGVIMAQMTSSAWCLGPVVAVAAAVLRSPWPRQPGERLPVEAAVRVVEALTMPLCVPRLTAFWPGAASGPLPPHAKTTPST